MHIARAEFVDHLPAGRTLALIRHGDETLLLLRKGEINEQVGQELTELVQNLLRNDGEGGQEWPPPSAN